MKTLLKIKEDTKICTKCKEYLPFECFSKNNKGILGLNSSCKKCVKLVQKSPKSYREYQKKYAEKNKIKRRDYANTRNKKLTGNNLPFGKEYQLKNMYNLSPEQYLQMIENQDNKCAICNKLEMIKTNKGDKIRSLSIDHHHESGRVRGLLCSRCNQAIGYMFEDIEILKSAIEYLQNN